jgi:transposase-like protein
VTARPSSTALARVYILNLVLCALKGFRRRRTLIKLNDPIFSDEAEAAAHIERSRWPTGEINCPHCGSLRIHRMGGKTQAGMFLCNACRSKFTVRTGTAMERSHVPLTKWLLATHFMAASREGMSASQLSRLLGVTYKTAWFLAHRLREAFVHTDDTPFSNDGSVVECDKNFIDRKAAW